MLIDENDTIPLLPSGRRRESEVIHFLAATLRGWFVRLGTSVMIRKMTGKICKRRPVLYGIGFAIVVVIFALSSVPVYHMMLARGLSTHQDNHIIEEVLPGRTRVSSLSPALFGGAFVAEAYGAGTEVLGSGGQGDDPVGILVHSSSLVSSLTPLTIEASSNERNGITTYTVEEGDTLSTIAARFGITTNTLLWANSLVNGSIIRPGDELKILPVTGLLHTVKSGETVSSIANKFESEVEEIVAFNGLPADGSIRVGDTLVIPDGVKPRPRYSAPTRRYARNLPNVSGYFLFPAPGRISQGAHSYNAVDIAHSGCYSYNVPVYSAASGRVTTADWTGWNGGFGQFVKIQHPNGTATLYAHLRQLLVGIGADVSQGQIIGYMGSTGRSTGCHVHFEVHGARNPFIF